ncbi:MAG: ATP-dependent RNA helicase HrpA [Gammaproteobacteria bacterium]|nr:ATP-dependent RNA helicase HrpA [Gammaproteobacteria bacterium]
MSPNSLPGQREIDACMLADRHGLRQRLKHLQLRSTQIEPQDQHVLRLRQQISISTTLAERRRQLLPTPTFPADLPISEKWEEIAELIAGNQVVVLCGETGSGKSTQLPKICLALGRGVYGRIGHTQPRRIAARSLAARLSEELGSEAGALVGYKVRFQDRVSRDTLVKLVTDGMLLAEVQQDRWLNEYDTIIVDEAHERSLNIDFLLGYLKKLLPQRPDLKLIITSATIDPERFAKHFGGAPIINVSGRTYPVEVRYRPPLDAEGERDEPLQQAILNAVDELSRIDRGDILIFLSGEREIRETAEHLRKHRLPLTEVLPLYARLGTEEQNRIFHPAGLRRIILATNVAETSLTVPGIRYVIDTGFARISRYSHRSKVQRLPVEAISRASAEQRKGRCGRIAAGICIRLYTEEDFDLRPEFTEPEILRTNLASVILQMMILGFGSIAKFPFINPPDKRLISDGYRVLEEVCAVDGTRHITRLGRQLARLPLDPRIARILLAGAHGNCLNELLVIAAALSIQDPRERPMEKQQAADEAHHRFLDEQSDFLGLLKLWLALEEQRRHLSRRKFQRCCRDSYLSWNRVQEWHDVYHQLRSQMHEMGYRENGNEASYDAVHRALLSGLLSHIGFRAGSSEREYLGARNSRFSIFPGSGLFKRQPKWVMAAELVETSRLYARTVGSIKPEWVESAAGHLVKRSYSEPHWERGRGQVAAYERVGLFGLTLIARRKVNFGPIDPVTAREIFIGSALVDGDFATRAPFWRHNQALIDYLEQLEQKARRRDLLVERQEIYDYYDKRVPEGIYSTPQFEKWLRGEVRSHPKLLHMRLQDLTRAAAELTSQHDFPDQFEIGAMRLPLSYHFDPGSTGDGVTLKVPVAVLNQVSEERCGWLVPGLLRERVIALLRLLPKNLRRSFVPVPEYADACLRALTPSGKPLTQALAEQLKAMTGIYIAEDQWQEELLPDYLRMNFMLLDEQGRDIASGRDLNALKQSYGSAGEDGYHTLPAAGLERKGSKSWDFGELPESVESGQGGINLRGFPALVDRGDSVDLKVLDARQNAERFHRAGVRRLLMLALPKEIRYLRRNLPSLPQMELKYARVAATPKGWEVPGKLGVEEELIALIVDLTFLEDQPEIRSQASFQQRIQAHKGALVAQALEAAQLLEQILTIYQQVRNRLSENNRINWMTSLEDIRQQLDQLVYRGFLQHTPYAQLKQLPRYLRAIEMRLDKLPYAAARDQKLLGEMQEAYQLWQQREEKYRLEGKLDERIEELRWSFEELRISLFAQELGTAYPVSLQRIQKRWRELGL